MNSNTTQAMTVSPEEAGRVLAVMRAIHRAGVREAREMEARSRVDAADLAADGRPSKARAALERAEGYASNAALLVAMTAPEYVAWILLADVALQVAQDQDETRAAVEVAKALRGTQATALEDRADTRWSWSWATRRSRARRPGLRLLARRSAQEWDRAAAEYAALPLDEVVRRLAGPPIDDVDGQDFGEDAAAS